MKILVVDDSSTMRRIVKNCLEQMGNHDIVMAGDGVDAIVKLKEHTFDLVLTDWNMPNMDGLTLLKKLRADENFKNVPIIMVTTESEKANVVTALKEGANNYIVKPFRPEIVKSKIEAVLKKPL